MTSQADSIIKQVDTADQRHAFLAEIDKAVQALDDNQRNLLVDDVLFRIRDMLHGIQKGVQDGSLDKFQIDGYLLLASNAISLAGTVNSVTRDKHPKWKIGKKTSGPVEKVLRKWMEAFRATTSGVLDTLGLPAEQLARIKSGHSTPADIEDVKRIVDEKYGDRANVSVIHESGLTEVASADAGTAGTGMYL